MGKLNQERPELYVKCAGQQAEAQTIAITSLVFTHCVHETAVWHETQIKTCITQC